MHVLAAAAMFGTWLGMAVFMLLAHRSGNTSVVALTARFVVSVELIVMIAAMALQPISGFALAAAIGLSPLDDFWIVISLAVYGLVAMGWLAVLGIEFRIRNLTRRGGARCRAAARCLSAPVPHLLRAGLADARRDGRAVCPDDLAAAARIAARRRRRRGAWLELSLRKSAQSPVAFHGAAGMARSACQAIIRWRNPWKADAPAARSGID